MNKDMKKTCSFTLKFKFLMLIPILLIVAAIVFGAIFGFNYDYDFKNVNTFNVKFNSTVTESEYEILEKEVECIITDNSYTDFRIDRIGEGAQNGLIVKIADCDKDLVDNIDSLKTTIENDLLSNTGDDIKSALVITTTDTLVNSSMNASSLILYSGILVLTLAIFAFIYYAIRYNIDAAFSLVLNILLSVAMLTSCLIVFRIPVNYNFVISYFMMTIAILVISTFVNNNIKENLSEEKYIKYSNSQRVELSIKSTIKSVVISFSLLIVALIGIMFFNGISFIYTLLSVLVGLLISVFNTYIFQLGLWSLMYKRDKDKLLQKRIEKELKKDEKKPEDKIVV